MKRAYSYYREIKRLFDYLIKNEWKINESENKFTANGSNQSIYKFIYRD